MNAIKTVVMLSVLGGVAYGVYFTLNKPPASATDEEAPPDWSAPPTVDLGTQQTAPQAVPPVQSPTAPSDGAFAPPYSAPTGNGDQSSAAQAAEAPTYTMPADAASMPSRLSQPSSVYAPDGPVAPSGQQVSATPAQTMLAPDHPYRQAASATGASIDPVAAAGTPHDVQPSGGAGPSLRYPSEAPAQAADQARASSHPQADFAAAMETVGIQLDQGNLLDAHMALSYWYSEPDLAPQQRQYVMQLLDGVAGTVIYSQQHLLEPAYEVQPGDTLDRVAERFQVPWPLLAKINGISDPNQLQPGSQLKVLRGPFTGLVDLDQYELTLWLQDRYAGRFGIGLGQGGSTPEGTFVVKAKLVNPTYYGPEGVIEADDPNNPLGERWIDLGNQIGLHGTNEQANNVQIDPRGCIRLSARDVDDVFDILSVGSKVIIRR